MSNKDIIITLILFFITMPLLVSQTLSEKYQSMNGINISAGVITSNFLNENFSNKINKKIIQRKIGYNVDINLTKFPLNLNLTYFLSNYKLNEYAGIYNKNVPIRHEGFEVGGIVYLFHFTKKILPFVGIGYQDSSIGVGNSIWDKSEPIGNNEPTSSITSSAIYKIGIQSMLNSGFGIRGEYKQTFNLNESGLNKSYNQFLLAIIFKIKVDVF